MIDSIKHKWVYGAGLLYVLVNLLCLYTEWFYWLLLPLGLAVVFLAVFRLDLLLLLIVFCTPISVTLDDVGGGLGLTLPTDPLLFGAMLIFLLKVFYDLKYDRRIIRHPITVVILLMLCWTFITSVTSDLPLVSFKYFLSRMWYVVPFYFVAVQMMKYPEKLNKYIWLYVVPMTGVIIYTIIRHGARGFGDEPAHWVMQPFFKDHTSYGAIIAMYIPVIFVYTLHKKWDINARVLAGIFLTVFLVGVIMSYTRAAWVSLVAGLGVMMLIIFRIRWYFVATLASILIGLFLGFRVEIMHKLEKNKQDSSSDFAEHVESISNVATDASNLERLNRWDAAFAMYFESPLVGKGPGTYSFLYAPYQHSSNLTIISTNFGDGGNAHSEYFGPLAEQGTPALILMLILIIFFYQRSIRLYYRLVDDDQKRLLMAVIIGVTTYLTHGILNNFLDTDKASIPFWGFMAIVVALDIYAEQKDFVGENQPIRTT